MSNIPRNKVNILAICTAKMADASQALQAAKDAKQKAAEQIGLIEQQFAQELAAANAELRRTEALIEEVVREGLDSQKLEKKADDIKMRIERLQVEKNSSNAADAAKEASARADKALADAETLLAAWREKTDQAERLRASYNIDSRYGAIEAPEYQSLDEAIDEYIDHIPLVAFISEEMYIETVALWEAGSVSEPDLIEIQAEEGKRFRYNIIPRSLSWLKKFASSDYASLPAENAPKYRARNELFDLLQVGDVLFVVRAQEIENATAQPDEQEWPTVEWLGSLEQFHKTITRGSGVAVKIPGPSLFSPQGTMDFVRAGLCYVNSEDKFYCLWNSQFDGVRMVKKQIGLKEQIQEPFDLDVSVLAGDFQVPMNSKLQAATAEFDQLLSAKTRLAARLRDAVQKVGALRSTFEPRNRRLSGTEIAKEIGAYWHAFIEAPWEFAVSGDVAMIKHLGERGIETPHFWSMPFKGHYGLRVRTRDHDWIIAQIYCPPESLAPTHAIDPHGVVYVRNSDGKCDELLKIDACYIQVVGRSR